MRATDVQIYEYEDKKTGSKVVKANAMYEGKTVSAFAKCDPVDEYDATFGVALATNRLDTKITKKRASAAMQKVKNHEEYINYLNAELKRARKAYEWAKIVAYDYKVELEGLKVEQKELLAEA
jgi:hypothetical protein